MFPGHGEQAEYNSVDAALWYIEAWRAYAEVSGDWQALSETLPVLEQIIAHYRDGTRYGIVMDPRTDCERAKPGCKSPGWMPKSGIG